MSINLNEWGVLSLATVVVILREGAEIVLFAFASGNQRSYVIGLLSGIAGATVLAYLGFLSLFCVNQRVRFNVTREYFVLQGGVSFRVFGS